MASSLLLSLTVLITLFSLSSSLPSSTVLDAADILSNSGFASMALSLELASQNLMSKAHSLTIFAPPETTFKQSSQLPLSLLQYHILPRVFSFTSLKSLPYGAKINTLLPKHSLTITNSRPEDRFSINNVSVNQPPIFQGGSLIIFGIERLFDPYFSISSGISTQNSNSFHQCLPSRNYGRIWSSEVYSFDEACTFLKMKGCSVMASLLELQFLGLKERPALTLFAPVDQALMMNLIGNLSDYSSIFRRHLVPCKILWKELMDLDDGSVLDTYDKGFRINVTKTTGIGRYGDEILLLNGASVIFPDLYYNDWLVVHGLGQVISSAASLVAEQADEFGSPFGAKKEYTTAHYHFSTFH